MIVTGSMRAPIFYDSNDTGYYGDFAGTSSLWGLAIRGDNGASSTANQIFLWGTGNTTTSAIGFKSNAGSFGNPTGSGDGYNTYFTMDTPGRGWVFRRGTGGSDFSAAYTAGWILNNGIAQFNASVRSPIFYDSDNTAYYGDFASTSRVNGVYADYIGVGQDINTSYRLITNGSIYLNSNGNGFAEGTWKQRRGGGTFYDVLDTASYSSYALPLAGGTLSGNLLFANSGTTKRGIQGTVGVNDMWFVGGGATAENAGFLEISTGDDGQTGGAAEPIYVRQYGPGDPLTGTLFRSASLLDANGNTSFPGNFFAGGYVRAYKGAASNTPGLEVRGGTGGVRIQTYGLDANADAWMGLGTDMGGNAYEHSVYFPYGAGGHVGLGRQTIGTYDGTTYSTKATFLANGRIGFGIASPEAALHVALPGMDDQLVLGSAATNRDIAMHMYSGTVKAEVLRFQSAYRLLIGNGSAITTQSFIVGGVERLTINGTGVVASRYYGGGFSIAGGSALILAGSGASFDNTTGARLSESYGPIWNLSNGATWHHQVINGSYLSGISAAGGNFGNGNYYGSGDVTAYYSDERLKTKVSTITNAIEKVKSLEGFIYVENELAKSVGYTNDKEQAGVSAQQIQAVLPQAVSLAPFDMQGVPETGEIISKSGENYLTVKYDRIVPLLIEAIKEQQTQIEKLQAQLNDLLAKQ
jgi:hypothetical protein